MNGIAAKVTNHPVKSASSPFVSGRLFRTELNQSPGEPDDREHSQGK